MCTRGSRDDKRGLMHGSRGKDRLGTNGRNEYTSIKRQRGEWCDV